MEGEREDLYRRFREYLITFHIGLILFEPVFALVRSKLVNAVTIKALVFVQCFLLSLEVGQTIAKMNYFFFSKKPFPLGLKYPLM